MESDCPARKAMKCLFENRIIRKYEGRKRTSIMTIISRNTKSTNDKFATFPMNKLDRNQLTEQSHCQAQKQERYGRT